MANSFPPPTEDPLLHIPRDSEMSERLLKFLGRIRMTKPWLDWLTTQADSLAASPQRMKTVSLTAQAASVAATSIPLQSVNAGLYRITYYARITQAATTSSSLTVSLAWTDGAVACSHSFDAITGNTVATTGSDTRMLRSDSASPITYSTTYASTGATPMQYALYITAERVDA